MSFGYSAGDFYLLVQLVGSIVESFGKGPRGATLQYSNFKAKFDLISQQLDEIPEKDSSFLALWGTTKAQCASFVLNYSSLASAGGKVAVDNEGTWKWLRTQGLKTLAKIKWPLAAREEAMTLQQNVFGLVQIAILYVGTQQHKAHQRNYEALESWLRALLLPSEVSELSEKLERRIDAVRLRAYAIMNLRNASTKMREPLQVLVSSVSDVKSPFACLYTTELHFGMTFKATLDHLWMIDDTMKNHIIKQDSDNPPSDSTIITLLEHIIRVVDIALSKTGYRLPDVKIHTFDNMNDQGNPGKPLSLVYENWVQLIEMAMERCKRSRAIQSTMPPRLPSPTLENIVEGSPNLESNSSFQEKQDMRVDTVHPGLSRRQSGDVSPRTRKSSSSRLGSFSSSGIIDSTIGKSLKLVISDADGNQNELEKSLEHCTVADIQFESGNDIAIIKVQRKDQKVTFRQVFGRDSTSSPKRVKKDQVVALTYFNSYEDFRTLDESQSLHPCGAPIYVFKSQLDSHWFQTEVLHRKIPGWKVIFSAETQHIVHDKTKKSCHLQVLRVIKDSTRCKSILYWETHLPDLTGGKEDFAEWSLFEFDSIVKSGEVHAILHFIDQTKEQKQRRKSSGLKSSWRSRRRSSKDLEQLSVISPMAPTMPTPLSSPLDSEDSKSAQSQSFISTSVPSSFDKFVLPSSAFEVKAESKAKAKKEIERLDIKFWDQKDRDDFISHFAWEPLSPT